MGKIKVEILAALAMSCTIAGGGAPEAAFRAPGDANRPEAYFFFFGGNISETGIVADLEAVKSAGIGGVKLFNGASARGAWPGVAKQIKCLSPEWDSLVGRYGEECKRLGIRMAMQVCPGWAMAGGPWIPPEKAMRHLTIARMDVDGGRRVEQKLPMPRGKNEPWRDYRDVAVVAFPAPDGDWERPLSPSSVNGTVSADWNAWARGRGAVNIPQNATTEITFDFASPVTVRTLELPSVRSLAVVTKSFDPRTTVSLKAVPAEDAPGGPRSVATTLIEELPLPPSSWQDRSSLSLACRETTARRFILTLKNSHPISLRTVRLLSAAKKDNWEGEACWTLRSLLHRKTPDQSSSAYVKSASVTNLTHLVDDAGRISWDAPPGRWAVLRIGHVNTGAKNLPAPPEGTGFECDKMSTDAADLQFDSYIGRLAAKDGPLNGALRVMLMDSWECGQQTWTPGLDAIFASRHGYDLFAWIPAVFGYVVDSPADTARFLDDWRTLNSDLISENFFGHMSARAHALGLEAEFEAAFGNSIPGDIMKYYKHADIPMCEFWHPAVSYNFTPVKPIISAARLYGKRGVGAEAFTSFRVTWNEKLRDYKHNANMNIAEGISHFVFHTVTHNPQTPWLPPGTSFGGRNIGAPFVRGQTWWRHLRDFTDYFARCQTMLESGSPISDGLGHLGDECDGRPDHYAPFPSGHKYDYCNPDAFLTRISVSNGRWRTPEGIEYRILWIPQCDRLLPETMEHIAMGIEKGAVAAMSALPEEPATRKGGEEGMRLFMTAREKLSKMVGRSPRDRHVHQGRLYVGKAIGDVLKAEGIAPDVRGEGIVWNHRCGGGDDWYFVAPAKEGAGFEGDIEFRASGTAEIWHPENGIIDVLNASTRIHLSLAPAQSCFVVFRKGKQSQGGPKTSRPVKRGDDAPAAVLGSSWCISFPAGWGMPASIATVALKPWRELGTTPEARAFSGTAVYETEFDIAALGDGTRVTLDLGRIESIARVTLNGKTFASVWAEPYTVDVTDAARMGRNKLKVEVTDTWFNRLAYDAGRPESERRTWAFRRPRKTEPLRDSGLIGPVRVYQSARECK